MRQWTAVLALLFAVAPDAEAALRGHGGPVRAIVQPDRPEMLVTAGFDQSVIRWALKVLGVGIGQVSLQFLPILV